MRKSRFTDEKMMSILRETNRESVAVVAKRQGLSEQTIYSWKKRFGTFEANDVRRLKQLELENAKLKKLLAERDLEIDVMTEINVHVSGPSIPLRDPPISAASAVNQKSTQLPSRSSDQSVRRAAITASILSETTARGILALLANASPHNHYRRPRETCRNEIEQIADN